MAVKRHFVPQTPFRIGDRSPITATVRIVRVAGF